MVIAMKWVRNTFKNSKHGNDNNLLVKETVFTEHILSFYFEIKLKTHVKTFFLFIRKIFFHHHFWNSQFFDDPNFFLSQIHFNRNKKWTVCVQCEYFNFFDCISKSKMHKKSVNFPKCIHRMYIALHIVDCRFDRSHISPNFIFQLNTKWFADSNFADICRMYSIQNQKFINNQPENP